jgi:hypothetical protein
MEENITTEISSLAESPQSEIDPFTPVDLDLATLDIQSLGYKKTWKIRIPAGDLLLECELPELLSRVPIENVEEIKSHWEERNIIDVERNFKHGIFDLDDENLRSTLQWHLRGMSIFSAVCKVRCDLVRRVSNAKKNKAKRLKTHGVNGFRIRTRVIVSSQPECSEDIMGWKGTIIALDDDHCFVRLDRDSKETDGSEKTCKLSYDCLSIMRAKPPNLKGNKAASSVPKPILKDEKLTTENSLAESPLQQRIASPEKANVDIESQPAKVEYTMTELVENLKLSKAKSPSSNEDKSSYTAILPWSGLSANELAEKLNVSRAKIYQMRSNGTLEAAGYRAESSGRSLSFVAIESSNE